MVKTKFGHKSTEFGQLLFKYVYFLYYIITKNIILGGSKNEVKNNVKKGNVGMH